MAEKAGQVKPLFGFAGTGHRGIRRRRILQAGKNLAFAVYCDDVRRRRRPGPEESGQSLHDLAQEGPVRHGIECRIARDHQPNPESPRLAVIDVVGKAGEIVQYDLGRSGIRSPQPVAQDSVAAGFRYQQEAIVLAERDAVGKVEPVDDDARTAASGIECDYPPVVAVFEYVQQAGCVRAAPFLCAELRGRIGEIDDAVVGDSEVIRIRQGFAVHFRQQVGDLA